VYPAGALLQAVGHASINNDTLVLRGTMMPNGSAYPTAADTPISIGGSNVSGGSRTYQCWYRNAAAFCTPFTCNLTKPHPADLEPVGARGAAVRTRMETVHPSRVRLARGYRVSAAQSIRRLCSIE
jgi:hypothetical protein